MKKTELQIEQVSVSTLKPSTYNPRKFSEEALSQLRESIKRYGFVDPVIVNGSKNRRGIIIGGHMRLRVAKSLGYKEVPVVYLDIPEIERERELNLRLNRNTGEWDWNLLAEFDETILDEVGFSSEEIDEVFPPEENPEEFDLQKELEKLQITKIEIQKGDIWEIGEHKIMCGDSTEREDILALMDGVKADMLFCDPPYRISYLKGKTKNGNPTVGFGAKKNRRYLETVELAPDFTVQWMGNVAAVAQDDFHAIVFENWKNLREIWDEVEKHWNVRNVIIWRLPNRTQGFAARRRFFSKYDIAVAGSSDDARDLNLEPEEELLQNEYETALYAIQGKPHWEPYKKGGRYCPTDFIDFRADDEKSSGQGIIFGTKPVEILIPYLKVLTKRGQIVIEPFGGSGSTMVAAEMLKRRCFLMEKSPVYAEVIRNRMEKLTGLKAKKLTNAYEQRKKK